MGTTQDTIVQEVENDAEVRLQCSGCRYWAVESTRVRLQDMSISISTSISAPNLILPKHLSLTSNLADKSSTEANLSNRSYPSLSSRGRPETPKPVHLICRHLLHLTESVCRNRFRSQTFYCTARNYNRRLLVDFAGVWI